MAETDAERKKQILQRVTSNPGINLRQVQRYTGIPLSTTARLLDELEDDRQVESESTAAFRRFFPVGRGLHKRERVVLGMVNKPRPRRILEAVLSNPGMRHGELADKLGLPAPTLTYYMKQIVAADLVSVQKKGVVRKYKVKNTAMVRKALQRTKGGFQETYA